MKKFLIALSALFLGLSMSAQTGEEILAKIENSNAKGVSIEHKFTEVRSWADNSRKAVTLDGNLVWKDGNLRMEYSNGDKFSIEGTKMTILRGGKSQVFDLTKNMMMRNLSNALTLAFHGRMAELSKDQKARILATKEGGDFIVTLSATQKAARGYNRIEVRYNAKNCMIKAMRMDEFSGLSTSYSIE